MDRLGEITVPTLVMAGRDDFLSRPSTRPSSLPGSRTRGCGSSSGPATTRTHERPAEVMAAVRDFMSVPTTALAASPHGPDQGESRCEFLSRAPAA